MVLEQRPGQPWPPSLLRLSRKPSGPRATVEFLYQSGTLSFWRERWTRNWCSDMTRSPTPPFCSSFSGGCNTRTETSSLMFSLRFAYPAAGVTVTNSCVGCSSKDALLFSTSRLGPVPRHTSIYSLLVPISSSNRAISFLQINDQVTMVKQ